MLQLAWKQPVPGAPPHPNSNPLEAVFERHHGLVFRIAYRITGNAADAEDVLQTVFLRLMKRADGAPELEQPESYLRRATINVSLDALRQRTQQPLAVENPPSVSHPDPDLAMSLRQALAQLDPKHAEMFVLRFFEGHSNGEIGEIMGISSLLVAVTLHRTRTRLQKFLNL